MHGIDQTTQELFAYRALEQWVPQDHPLRLFKLLVDSILRSMDADFTALYSTTGRASIPPERLLRASLLQVTYTVRSERLLCEQIEFNLLYRWFVGLGAAHLSREINKMESSVTFTVGLAYEKGRLFVAASPDADPPYSPYTVWYVYVASDIEEPWVHFVTRWWAVAACRFHPPGEEDWALVGMSNEGELDFGFTDSQFTEKIPGAGVNSDDAMGWGYMSALRQIGHHLYACGSAGQVYRRTQKGQWAHFDQGLLQTPEVSERLLLRAIDGPHEQAIYAIGAKSSSGLPAVAYFWNGQIWNAVPLPDIAERLTAIHVESEKRIWLCGANGTLLVGNAQDGFVNLSGIENKQLFLALGLFDRKIYLGSNIGLHTYDLMQPGRGIQSVFTGMATEIQDCHSISVVAGELWVIGTKDIATFDGQRWERIHHPDNKLLDA